jgi:hypothetical protein
LADRLVAAMPILAAIMTMFVFVPFAPNEIDANHDGLMLKPALDLLSGQALFRDTMSLYGPLNTYIQAGFLTLLGPRLISLRICTVVMYGLAGGFLAAAWGRLLTPALTALSLLLWWSLAHFFDGSPMVPWSSVNSLMFQAAALYFLLKSTPASGLRPLAYPLLCGMSAGLCYWCRFNVGLPLIAALGVSYLILACAAGERPLASRRLYAFVVGNLTVHLAFLAIIVSTGATTDWIEQNYTLPAKLFAGKGAYWALRGLLRCMLIPPAFRVPLGGDPVWAFLPLVPIFGSIAALVLGFMAMIPAGAAELAPDRDKEPARSRPVAPAVIPLVLGLFVLMVMVCQPFPEVMKRHLDYRFMPREYWFFLIPHIVLAATAAVSAHWLFRRGRGAAAVPEALLSGYLAGLVALASWTQYYPLGDSWHGWWALAPGIGVFAFFILRLAPSRPLAVASVLGVLMMPTVLQRSTQAVGVLLQPRITVRNPPVLSGMRLLLADHAALSPFLAALDGYVAKHPETALLVNGAHAAIYLTLVPDLSNPSNIWYYDRLYPIPRPGEVEACRREFIRNRRPLVVYILYDDPSPSQRATPDDLKGQEKNLRVSHNRRADMEEVLRDGQYVEIASTRVAGRHASLVLLGPRE